MTDPGAPGKGLQLHAQPNGVIFGMHMSPSSPIQGSNMPVVLSGRGVYRTKASRLLKGRSATGASSVNVFHSEGETRTKTGPSIAPLTSRRFILFFGRSMALERSCSPVSNSSRGCAAGGGTMRFNIAHANHVKSKRLDFMGDSVSTSI